MRKWIAAGALALALMVLFAPTGVEAAPEAQSSDQYYVIELVNALRAEYGLPPYTINPALMAAAQAHSEWAGSMGTHSHTGAGGSTPTDRAIAAGYGGGRSVRVSENIYWGTMATPQSALNWWRNSPIHFRGMTSTNYAEIGAGVAYTDAGGYFTLKFGIVSGNAPAAPAPSAGGSAPSDNAAAPAAAIPLPVYIVEPVELAEPQEDGSIVHVVGEGQNPWDIAEAYEVPVSEILALNRLSDADIIRPGDELIIKPAPVEPAPAELVGPYYHTVQDGQTLFGIAKGYNVPLWQVLELNGLNENSVIYPGDKLLVRPGDPTAVPTPETTPTPTPDDGATEPAPTGSASEDVPEVEPVPTDAPSRPAVAEADDAPTDVPERDTTPPIRGESAALPGQGLLIGALIVVGLAGMGLVVFGAMSRKDE